MLKKIPLRTFNLIMSGLHFAQAVAMYLLSTEFKLPINTNYLYLNEQTFKLEPMVKTIAEVNFGPLIALFLLLSSIAHLIVSLPKVYEWYEANLKKGINYARWYEYALSSSLMIVVIAMLTGVYDLSTLILLFSINACMIFFGLVMEVLNQYTKTVHWSPFNFGSFAGLIPWVVITLYLYAGGREQGPPDFVYAIFFSLFIFFNSFALNMVLQYKKVGPWKDYTFGERMYIVLSLVAKSLLAWQVWAGTLRPV